jgi:topoisomerase IA-like protein
MPNNAVELVVDNKGVQSAKIPMMKGLSNEPTGESYFYNRGKVADGQDPNKFYINDAAKKNRDNSEHVLTESEFYELLEDFAKQGRSVKVGEKTYKGTEASKQIDALEAKAKATSAIDIKSLEGFASISFGDDDIKNVGLNNKVNSNYLG